MNKDYMYIVAGDLMQDKFNKLYPDIHTIPFREDFSKGSYNEPFFNEEFINNRCSVHNTTKNDYINKLDPIINLDFNKEYILCFGEDECCKENLKFGCIKGVIIAVVLALTSLLSTLTTIFQRYSVSNKYYKNYTSSELWEKRWDALGDAQLFTTFLKNIVVYVIAIALFALILFIIAKLVKKSKDYQVTLSMLESETKSRELKSLPMFLFPST